MTAIPDAERPPSPGWSLIKRFLVGALLIVALTAAATATAGLLEISDDVAIFSSGHKIPGIGKVTEKSLHEMGIRKIGDLAALDEDYLKSRFGQWGLAMAGKARLGRRRVINCCGDGLLRAS